MNDTEHRNYIIAVIVSLIFHFSLLAIYLGSTPASKNPGLETFPVGLVEIASSSSSAGLRAEGMVSQPNNQSIITVAHNQRNRQPHKVKTEIKPNVNSNQPSKNIAALSKKAKIAVSGNPVEKPGNQSRPPGGNIETKSNLSPDSPSRGAIVPPKKEETVVSNNPGEKPGNQIALSGNNEKLTASQNSAVSQPQDLGTGEAMVTVLGPMPTYPSKAMKEGKEGNVAVRIFVNAGGGSDLAIVTKSSGDLRLDYAAISSIKQKWKFKLITKGYYIDLVFSFNVHIGVSVRFLNSKTRY
jgi:TonB family protein